MTKTYLQAGLCRVRLLCLARIASLATGLAASLSCRLTVSLAKEKIFGRHTRCGHDVAVPFPPGMSGFVKFRVSCWVV
jgi:hypothetical protein